jgi:hypothetical protein
MDNRRANEAFQNVNRSIDVASGGPQIRLAELTPQSDNDNSTADSAVPRQVDALRKRASINQFISMSTFVDCAGVE